MKLKIKQMSKGIRARSFCITIVFRILTEKENSFKIVLWISDQVTKNRKYLKYS